MEPLSAPCARSSFFVLPSPSFLLRSRLRLLFSFSVLVSVLRSSFFVLRPRSPFLVSVLCSSFSVLPSTSFLLRSRLRPLFSFSVLVWHSLVSLSLHAPSSHPQTPPPIHVFAPFHGWQLHFDVPIHIFAPFHGRQLHFDVPIHVFAPFHGWQLDFDVPIHVFGSFHGR